MGCCRHSTLSCALALLLPRQTALCSCALLLLPLTVRPILQPHPQLRQGVITDAVAGCQDLASRDLGLRHAAHLDIRRRTAQAVKVRKGKVGGRRAAPTFTGPLADKGQPANDSIIYELERRKGWQCIRYSLTRCLTSSLNAAKASRYDAPAASEAPELPSPPRPGVSDAPCNDKPSSSNGMQQPKRVSFC
jgi:hypothetical protein